MLVIKAFFRFLSFISLVVAVLIGVLDSVRSISTEQVDLMSAHSAWEMIWPQSLSMVEGMVTYYLHPEAWRSSLAVLSDMPASAAFLALALLFWILGYRKNRLRPEGYVGLA